MEALIPGDKIEGDSISGDRLEKNSITSRELAPNSVDTIHVIDGAITTAKLAGEISGDKLAKTPSIGNQTAARQSLVTITSSCAAFTADEMVPEHADSR